jgi:UDP-2,4-diacetamido-2,4,6-trideoxy-beta-L-altropyranose hydrolase
MLVLRKAYLEDCRAVYDLRIDEDVRKASVDPSFFSYSSHETWFTKSLSAENRRIYVAVDACKIIQGVVRYDISGEEAEISIFVSKYAWGKGVGSFCLTNGENALKAEMPLIKRFTAVVLPHNLASKRLFEKNGFYMSDIKYVKEVL